LRLSNDGNDPAATGPAAFAARLGAFVEAADALTFEVPETRSIGQIVINHCLDTFASRVRPLVWEGIDVFSIRDGKIAEGSDYTIRMSR
jgi:ketosteroid isomerase-like protein